MTGQGWFAVGWFVGWMMGGTFALLLWRNR